MITRLVIKFPIPYEWWSNSRPLGQEKASNVRGMPGEDVEASIWLVHKVAFTHNIPRRIHNILPVVSLSAVQ